MKMMSKYILNALMLLGAFTSCSDDNEGIIPMVNMQDMNFRAESAPGNITLKWDIPENPDYLYLELRYFDPREKKNCLKSLSSYTESITIEDTRARYGEYSFTFTPFSEDGTPGESFTLTTTSKPAPITTRVNRTPIKLSIDNLYTNAQQPGDGPLENILDGNASTYFQSQWAGDNIPDHQYIDIDLTEPVTRFELITVNRGDGGGANGIPETVKWYRIGSLGDETVDVTTATPIYQYTQPDRSSGAKCSFLYPAEVEEPLNRPIQYIRYYVRGKNGQKTWNLGDLSVNKVEIVVTDPEVDEVAEYDE
jgi:hypothetical protein|uniref:discoidin domain-containing protein n=1 Tax=Bacteroides caccae TaxID=47678 RepID=UPI00359C7161